MGEKNNEITDYIAQYESAKRDRLDILRTLIHESITEIQEKMWTKVPCMRSVACYIYIICIISIL